MSEEKDNITALQKHAREDLAINAKRGEVVGYLLQEGGFAKHLNQQQQAVAPSPVVEAAGYSQYNEVRILLDGGTATVDDRDKDGRTALMWASQNGHQKIVSMLDGLNALHSAVQGGHWEVIKFLSSTFRARIRDGDNSNVTMLHWAAYFGHCQVTRCLIEEFGMDPQDREKWGATALLSAAFGGSVLVGKMLVEECGSSIDEEAYDNCHGWNALHFAAGAGHLEMVKYLLPLFGEKKFKQDNDGCTCLDLAINAKRGEVVGYLLQEGGFAKHLNQQQQR